MKSGDEGWSKCIGSAQPVQATDHSIVLVGDTGSFESIDVSTGKRNWIVTVPHPTNSTRVQPTTQPVALKAGSVIVALMNSSPNEIIGLDAETGGQLWTVPVPLDPILPMIELVNDDLLIVRDNVVEGVPRGVEPGYNRPIILYINPATGQMAEPAVIAPNAQSNDIGEVRVEDSYQEGLQQITLYGRKSPGPLLWSKEVPGMSAQLVGPNVIVIDQTGGTGTMLMNPLHLPKIDTRVTAYDVLTGEVRWQTALPGTPQRVSAVESGLVVSDRTQVRLLDSGSGTTIWTADHGSPAVGGKYSEPGGYRSFTSGSGDGPMVGWIVAEEPYRD